MTHTVFFWLKDELSDDAIARFEDGVSALTTIESVQRGYVGKPAPTPERSVTDHSFSYHLSLEFASVEDHDAYQDHPDHHEFVEACKDLWETVIVYDSEPI